MAKFCANCGNELADEAAMCVKCGTMVSGGTNTNNNTSTVSNTTGKKKGLPTWAIVLIIVGCVILIPVIIFVVFAIIGYNAIKDAGSEVEDKINDYIQENTGSDVTGTIGDTLSDSEMKLTLTGAYMYDRIGEGYLVNTPKDGKEYLLFFFDVENISSEEQFISYFDFDGYVDDVSINTTTIFGSVDDKETLSATIATGKKASGFVAFEVDKTWEEFELHYDNNAWDNSGDLIFKVVNSN